MGNAASDALLGASGGGEEGGGEGKNLAWLLGMIKQIVGGGRAPEPVGTGTVLQGNW